MGSLKDPNSKSHVSTWQSAPSIFGYWQAGPMLPVSYLAAVGFVDYTAQICTMGLQRGVEIKMGGGVS